MNGLKSTLSPEVYEQVMNGDQEVINEIIALTKYFKASEGKKRELTAEQRKVLEKPVPTPLDSTDLKGLAEYIRSGKAKRIVTMAGAGISTACGIPDFRSEGGLYKTLKMEGLRQPEDIFTLDFFLDNPNPFYKLAPSLLPEKFHPSKTHYFIKLLEEKGLLLRHFTQNIDMLESIAHVNKDLVIHAHGCFDPCHCVKCHEEVTYEEFRKAALDGTVLKCKKCGGFIKPDIVFFGEGLPQVFFDHLDELEETDLLIVMGTSLTVHPFAGLVEFPPEQVPRVFINRDPAFTIEYNPDATDYEKYEYRSSLRFKFDNPENRRDLFLQGNCDEWVEKHT